MTEDPKIRSVNNSATVTGLKCSILTTCAASRCYHARIGLLEHRIFWILVNTG